MTNDPHRVLGPKKREREAEQMSTRCGFEFKVASAAPPSVPRFYTVSACWAHLPPTQVNIHFPTPIKPKHQHPGRLPPYAPGDGDVEPSPVVQEANAANVEMIRVSRRGDLRSTHAGEYHDVFLPGGVIGKLDVFRGAESRGGGGDAESRQ